MKKTLGFASLLLVACSSTSATNGPDGGASSGNPATNPDGGNTTPDGGSPDGSVATTPAKALHLVTGAAADDRITGVYCPNGTQCLVTTNGVNAGSISHVYAIDTATVNTTTPLFSADTAFSDLAGVSGSLAFLGFDKVDDQLIARLENAEVGYVSASGDPLSATNWKAQKIGTDTGVAGDFGLNSQYGFARTSAGWIQARMSFIYTAPAAPSPTTAWTPVWSPKGVGEIPSNLEDLHTQNPTLCRSEVAYSNSPNPTQPMYTAANGELIVYPSNAYGQYTEDPAGLCISTDGGNRFHLAALPGLGADILGPTAVHCLSKDHCVAAGGQYLVDDTVYAYVSNNASQGAASTWTKATIPTGFSNQTIPSQFFFAPDNQTGWLAGSDNAGPMLWKTTDGGATWTDQKAAATALTDKKLWSGFAVDADHYVIGAEGGVILSTF